MPETALPANVARKAAASYAACLRCRLRGRVISRRRVALCAFDRLEAIKIEHENGQLLPIADGAKMFIEFFGEETAVWQLGEEIVPRQLTRLSLCADTCFYLTRDVLVAAKPVNDEGDT